MRIYRIPKFAQMFFPSILWSFPEKANAVFLTFDDGPHKTFTPQILDILDEHRAKATFFLSGMNIKGNEKIILRMHESGYSIGIHGYEHFSLLGKPRIEIKEQILRTRNEIEFIVGKPVNLFRPPYGIFNPKMVKICQELSLHLVIWSFMPYDFYTKISDGKLVDIFQKKLRAGDIVVLHDGHENSGRTVGVLEEMVRWCRNKGLKSEVINLSNKIFLGDYKKLQQ